MEGREWSKLLDSSKDNYMKFYAKIEKELKVDLETLLKKKGGPKIVFDHIVNYNNSAKTTQDKHFKILSYLRAKGMR